MGQSEPIRSFMIRDYRVLIATSDTDVGRALSIALGFEGYYQRQVEQPETYKELLSITSPHAVIFDEHGIDGMRAIDCIRDLSRMRRDASIYLLLSDKNIELAFEAAKRGVNKVFRLPIDLEYVTRQIGRDLVEQYGASYAGGQTQRGYPSMTPREKQVAELVVEGHNNKVIGHILGISPRTAEVHRSRVLHKFNANNTAAFVRAYMESGLAR